MDRAVSSVSGDRSSWMSLATSCALMAVLLAPASVGVASICHRGLSNQALFAAAVAGGVCWLAATLALVTTYCATRLKMPVQGVLVGMLFRTGLPLGAAIGLPQWRGSLAVDGMGITILGVYLIALAGETLLSVRMIPRGTTVAKQT
jgi:hypothetical protein